MSNLQTGNTQTKDAIRIFGGTNKNIPRAKPSIEALFSVVADTYMIVPFEYLENVVCLLKSKRYVYKVKSKTKYVVIALQYQLPE